jgi:hypothetical protein
MTNKSELHRKISLGELLESLFLVIIIIGILSLKYIYPEGSAPHEYTTGFYGISLIISCFAMMFLRDKLNKLNKKHKNKK